MDAKRIIGFLKEVAANNNRAWFQEHKADYECGIRPIPIHFSRVPENTK